MLTRGPCTNANASDTRSGRNPRIENVSRIVRIRTLWCVLPQEYVRLVPGGAGILQDKVSRLFPTDDSPPLDAGEVVSMLSITRCSYGIS